MLAVIVSDLPLITIDFDLIGDAGLIGESRSFSTRRFKDTFLLGELD